tara:strand:- start:500 stop:1690 length:1191 start_codon:yes stop_codon:yes gene_type:complete
MRVSASGIAGLFYKMSSTKVVETVKSNSEPTDFAKKNVFPHGNVNEHRALEIVKQHYPDTHGQSAFARMIDHTKDFIPNMEQDIKYATNVRQPRAASFPEFRILQHWKAETEKLTAYSIHGVTYDIGRREKKIGNVTLVCQPDGLCQGDRTTIEVKCPYGEMYTLDNTEKWLKHVVQAAIEMMVFGTDKTFLIIYYAPRAVYTRYQDRPQELKRIELTRQDLGPLISQISTFIHRLGALGSGENEHQIYASCEDQLHGLFVKIQQTIQKVPIVFKDMAIPQSNQADSATVAVVFIGNKKATLVPGAPYHMVAEPANQYDAGAIRVVPAHGQLSAPCYVTRNSKGSWLLPLLDRVVNCRAVAKDLLEITFGEPVGSAAGTAQKKRRRGLLDTIELKF